MNVKEISLTGILLSLVMVLAPISIPLGIVPFSLQTFIIPLAVSLLSRRNGVLLVVAYLILGGFGLPVFANLSSGWAVFAGPTGGYLVGMLVFPLVLGIGSKPRVWQTLTLKVVLAALIQLLVGAIWLGAVLNLSVMQALMAGVLPFLLAMLMKSGLVVGIVVMLQDRLALNVGKSTVK